MESVIVAIVLFALLLAVGAAFLWQERNPRAENVAIYSVEDSIAFIFDRLTPDASASLKRSDVRRILEWEVRYLQEAGHREAGAVIVAGGHDSAIFVQRRAHEAGYSYDGPLIVEVLELQAQYLAAIGAVGEPVDDVEALEMTEEAE